MTGSFILMMFSSSLFYVLLLERNCGSHSLEAIVRKKVNQMQVGGSP